MHKKFTLPIFYYSSHFAATAGTDTAQYQHSFSIFPETFPIPEVLAQFTHQTLFKILTRLLPGIDSRIFLALGLEFENLEFGDEYVFMRFYVNQSPI